MNFTSRSISFASFPVSILFLACSASGPGRAMEPAQVNTPVRQYPSVFEATLADGDTTPEVTTRELKLALQDPRIVILDARPYEEFAKSHIPGARTVPGLPGLSPSKYTADANEVTKIAPDRGRALIVYCNGLHCGRSKRFALELRRLGYTNVRRYQLGIPAWRALGGVTQVEKEAFVALLAADATAVLVDARESASASPRLRGARWIPAAQASKAKDDGRLPMTDHNTRIFVVADGEAQARAAAEAIVKDAFHNVSFFAGKVAELEFMHEH